MAFGGSLKTPTMLEQLLEEINFQRTKEMRQMLKDESGFVVLQGTSYWTDLFVRHFLFQEERSIDCDDLLFFVRKRHVKGSSRYLPKYETEVEVFRKDSKKLPIGDPEVDWEETVYLNLVVHQFEYALTLGVCTRTSPKELQVVRRCSQRVYASPSRRKMDTKGESEEMTYPHICFMVDNFDEVFNDIVVRDGEMVCVELTAKGRGCSAASVIFLGSIRYDALARVYDTRQTSLSTRVAQRMSFGLLGGKAAARCEFVRMKGPGGKGHAEMAVSKPHGAGVDTPSSEPGVCATDMWDSDWEDDPEDMMVYRNQRRLSDPSANIHNFCRGGIRTKDARDKSRSENEGLDSLVSGIAEIEGGDLRDESRASSGPWCCVPPRSRKGIGGLNPRPHAVPTADPDQTEYGPPPLKPFTLNTKKTPSKQKKKESKDKESKDKECEMADDVASLNETQILCCETKRRTVKMDYGITVRGKEELPCYRESHVYNLMRRTETATAETNGNDGDDECEELSITNRGARAYCTLPRSHAGAASVVFRNGTLPPRRTTPDGTDIYYWCDVPKKKWRELDDGAYNPLWQMRGFTQSFHLWKEGRRQQSTPLNAYLTYVTLPWWSIAKDILDHREEPILTF